MKWEPFVRKSRIIARKSLQFASLLVALALPAVAQAQNSSDILRFSIPFPVSSHRLSFGTAEILTQFRADGQIHPWLLESIESIDPLTWILRVRDGVRFQNGRSLDATAVLEAIEFQLETASGARSRMPAGAQFTVVDARTLSFRSDQPFPALPGVLALSAFAIFDADALRAAGGTLANPIDNGIFTGPYELVAPATQDRLELVVNNDYWQGQPALDAITVTYVPDPNASVLAIRNGEIDVALYMPLAVRPVAEATPGLHFNFDTPHRSSFSLFLNRARPPFNDPAVARAIVQAIDYAQIANEVFRGAMRAPVGFFAQELPYTVANITTDRAAAAARLDDADWRVGKNGIRARNGVPLEIRLVIVGSDVDLVTLASALQAQLRPIGIAVRIVTVDDRAAAMANLDNWEAGIGAFSVTRTPEIFLNEFFGSTGSNNLVRYSNAEAQALIHELGMTIDPARRTEILHRVQEIVIIDDPYFFPLTWAPRAVVTSEAWHTYQTGFQLVFVHWQTRPAQ